ncbi:hypothetical protein MJG53_007236 [Ovis ammon polii x Ovis aries]|uniref:Uncharacterized protein n=1 Tax=Ovis ammon polii x Ovis aries TaxID=2918886 RepID=A0ACB9V2N3_9CETA|nr:hypothetical protein MJG53_007236 [Ovis ammon polii x Ovis aries]
MGGRRALEDERCEMPQGNPLFPSKGQFTQFKEFRLFSIICDFRQSQIHTFRGNFDTVVASHSQWDLAELQLNHTGSRQDPRLRWQGSPALGRSFLHGPELDDNGQLRIQRDGIYRLHIQVTLANCSSSTWTAEPQRATLTVAICSPAAHSISLLRLSFHRGACWVASQRLTFLAHGDILCTNLTLPLLPSRNTDETFFGIQWVRP